MRAFLAFTKKEFMEFTRTYKLFAMGMAFLLLGMMNPLTAKFTPQILEKFMPEGMNITVTEPTALDSWMQFFSNIPQMGLIVLVIVFGGIMAHEFSRGTLTNMLTKGLSRSTVILSKFLMAVVIWAAAYGLCTAVSYGYTVYYWNNEGVTNLLFSIMCLWLFGVLLLAAIMLGGVLFKSTYGCLLFMGGFVVVLFLLKIPPKLQEYNPIGLASENMKLVTGDSVAGDFTWSIFITVMLSFVFILCAILIFNKKQM